MRFDNDAKAFLRSRGLTPSRLTAEGTRALDADGDRRVTAGEARAFASRMSLNDDGLLDDRERRAAARLIGSDPAPRLGRKAKAWARENGAGTITPDERRALDANRNGVVNREEIEARLAGVRSGTAAPPAEATPGPRDAARMLAAVPFLHAGRNGEVPRPLDGALRGALEKAGVAPEDVRSMRARDVTGGIAIDVELAKGASGKGVALDPQLSFTLTGRGLEDVRGVRLEGTRSAELRSATLAGDALTVSLDRAYEGASNGTTVKADRTITAELDDTGARNIRGLRARSHGVTTRVEQLHAVEEGLYVKTGGGANLLAHLLGLSPRGAAATVLIPPS